MRQTKISRLLSEIDSVSGSGTSLISLYISSETNLQSKRNQISQEKNEAENIKNDTNRKNVLNALS